MRKMEFDRLDLAERGDAEAQYMLARHCFNPPDQDIDEAVAWLGKAADQNHIEAMELLAEIYLKNWAPGCVPQQAVGLLKQLLIIHDPKVSEERQAGAVARIKLGMILCKGDLTDINLKAGQKLIDIGVGHFTGKEDAGHTEFPLLCADLHRLYWNAKKVIKGGITGNPIKDNEKCIEYCKLAIKHGIPEQQIPYLEEMIDLATQQNEEIRRYNEKEPVLREA
jgi:hypothetical protein